MSSNTWVNYGIAAVGAVVVGFATAGMGLAWFLPAMATFSVTATVLNAMYARPNLGNIKGMGGAAFGSANSDNRQNAAAQGMQIASASEAIAIPVVFGTQRVGTNYLRYDKNTFRSVPIIERVQRDPGQVALEEAQRAYKRNPSKVEQKLDSEAAQQQSAQGGKGAAPSPPPSTYLSINEKVQNYASVLLQRDQSGKRKLPIRYDEFVVGYEYYLSFELGICMGPVDRLERIRSYPGEAIIVENSTTPDTTANSYAFTARGRDDGGALRFYPGRLDQTRETGDVYKETWSNYRGVAFAMLTNFKLGQSPAPHSYSFEVTRFPICLDADGVPLTDFPVRGAPAGTTKTVTVVAWAAGVVTMTATAHGLVVGQKVMIENFAPAFLNGRRVITATPTADSFSFALGNPGTVTTMGLVRATHPCYYDANPAAALYEIFTNTRWGRGMSPNDIDIESFRVAAQYFEANNIGMSFTLETQNVVSDAVEIIRNHVSTLVVAVAGTLRCLCLLDRSAAYTPRIRLTSENVSDPQMSRPGWVNTVNELRCEFQNRLNNYQNEVVVQHDDGNLATVQRINSQKLSMPAFSNRDTADRMCAMLLQQMAYPQGTLRFTMNHFERRMEPGNFVEFVWTEWSDGPTTTYWRVAEMSDGDQDEDGITVTLIEDVYMTPVQGIAETFEAPVPAYEGGVTNDDDDIYLGEDRDDAFDQGNLLFQVVELPIFLTDADKFFAVFCQRDSGRIQGLNLFAREDGGGGDFVSLGSLNPWAYFGTLATPLSILSRPTLTRQTLDLTINLENEDDRAILLEIFSLTPTDADDVDAMVGGSTNWMVINEEIFQVAQAVAGGADDQIVITGYLRGQQGSTRRTHSPGSRVVMFFEFIPRAFTARYDRLPLDVPLEFKAVTYNGQGQEGLEYTWTHTLTNRGRKALAIEDWDTTGTAGLNWEVEFRPRFHNRGAHVFADLDADMNTFTGEVPDLYEWYVMPQDASDVDLLTAPVKLTVAWVQDDGETISTGMASFSYVAPSGTDHLIFYTVHDGVLGFPVQMDPP